MAARKISWSQLQEQRLAECWVYVSENTPKDDGFWDRVLEKFNRLEIDSGPWPKADLIGKWSEFCTTIPLLRKNLDESRIFKAGQPEDDILFWAEMYYYTEQRKRFDHLSAWEVLKDNSKFQNEIESSNSTSSA